MDWEVIQDILRDSYRRLSLPLEGAFPNRQNKYRRGVRGEETLCVPPVDQDVVRKGWWSVLKDKVGWEPGTITVPLLGDLDDLPYELTAGMTFRHRSNQGLGVLSKIGVVDKKVLFEERLIGPDSIALYESFLIGDLPPVYEYHVLQDYPQWDSYITSI
jgi:hypothetical protein